MMLPLELFLCLFGGSFGDLMNKNCNPRFEMATYHLVALALSADDDVYNHGAGRSILSTTIAPGTFWSGLIDDIRIYNRVASQ